MTSKSSTVRVLGIQGLTSDDARRISAIDPRISYSDACGWFDGEIRQTWNAFASARYLAPDSSGAGTREERDDLLATAEVIYGGWPYPLDLRRRAPRLKWFHQRNAGASNLRLGDLWGSDVLVTTSRGGGNTGPMAEYVLSGILHFARGLHRAEADRTARKFSHRSYKPFVIAGKTVCVIGAGGIGRAVAEICSAAGMRVVGTRRSPPATPPPPFEELASPQDLDRLLSKSHIAVVCCQWTPETTHLINAGRLAAMKPGGILVNVARGEIVDEAALMDAIDTGHLRGAALDVYDGEFERNPPERLWSDPRVLITPHVSAGTDVPQSGPVDIFCRNLRAYIDGKPMENILDWERWY